MILKTFHHYKVILLRKSSLNSFIKMKILSFEILIVLNISKNLYFEKRHSLDYNFIPKIYSFFGTIALYMPHLMIEFGFIHKS